MSAWAIQCQTAQSPALSGTIQMGENWKPVLYLVKPRSFKEIAANYSGAVVDSAAIGPDGHFAFNHFTPPEQATLYQIFIQESGSRFANKISHDNPWLSNYCPVILKRGESLRITAFADHLQQSARIERPTPENKALLSLRDIRLKAFNDLEKQKNGLDAHDENAILAQEEAVGWYRAPLMTFADSTPFMLPALVAVRWVSPEGDYERVPEFLNGQCKRWQATSPDQIFVGELCALSNPERLPLLVGGTMPDFALPMLHGDTVHLKSLMGTRLTVIDLWASWCAPCRRENREFLVPLWNEFAKKGLQIVGYSLDSSQGAWQSAIEKDHADWPQASHLQGDASPFLEALRITTIPANFLVDAEGTVVAKNLHGASLKTFVEDYLSKN